MDEYLTKPIDTKLLKILLEDYLGENTDEIDKIDNLEIKKSPNGLSEHFIKEKLLEKIEGDSKLYKSMIEVALLQWELDIENLGNYIKIEDFKLIRGFAHKIKGASLTMECPILAELSAKIEKKVQYDKVRLMEMLNNIKDEFKIFKKIFNSNNI